MAETYTPNLGLTVIGTNDLAGSWGSATNNNLQYGLEQAITGYYGVTYAGADQQVTLPGSSGPTSGTTSSQARSLYYVLSGTNTAQQNFFVPAGNTKLYIIKNATSGGFGIQVFPGTIGSPTGLGIVVPNGATYIVYNDGTNINLVSAYPAVITISTPYTFATPASGTAVTANAASGYAALALNGVSGTAALSVQNTGIGVGSGLTDQGAGTVNVQNSYYISGINQFRNGTFTGNLTGFTSPPSPVFSWSISGDVVCLSCTTTGTAISAGANYNALSVNNLPSAIQPVNTKVLVSDYILDNGQAKLCNATISGQYLIFGLYNTNVVSPNIQYSPTGFSNGGNKGILAGWSVTYSLKN